MKDTFWVRVPCTTNVEGDKEERARRREGKSLRGREKGSTRGREAGAEIEKALVCFFLTSRQPVKSLYPPKGFFST